MAVEDVTEQMRDQLHTRIMEAVCARTRDNKLGIRGPGIEFNDSELYALLRLTRARATVHGL